VVDRRLVSALVLLFLLVVTVVPTRAQQPAASDPPADAAPAPARAQAAQVDELRRRVDVLAAELERLRSGEPEQRELTGARRRALGLAPSAAATYRRANEGVSFAGYGEMLLENYRRTNESGAAGAPTTRLDVLRAVLYTGYRFSDRFLFNSELEVEHGNEIYVEFAYVDFQASDNLSFRGGMLLLPLGLVNEFHEPTVFLGARRPETEQRIIPSTWRENGAGVLGAFGIVNARVYVTNGFSGAGFTSAGLRGGRQRGIQARAANMAVSGRVDVTPLAGVVAGVGFYSGGSGQEQVILDGRRLSMGTTIAEVHGQAQFRGIDARVLFARATLDEAASASRALRLATTAPIAEAMQGGYVQLGYNILSQRDTTVALTPYVRHEAVDTQHRVPAGFSRDLSRDGAFTTVGVELKPIPNVVIKTDYQWLRNEAGSGRNQFNLNLGYAF
jgi:cell division protein FtsB